ncbi:hypothetical protein QZM93_38265 [Burkholderia cepacia]|uniref:hypothetical protein n=1 Tax=Burkholderia cepacia TaxID=292 RepID=UPI00264CAF43|nr:hypothetical protein [Burkholderia cepacia]MDN7894448.1 hypothetical protein [Burkholderia cepacia]
MRTLMGVMRLVNADAERFYVGERNRVQADYEAAVDAQFGRGKRKAVKRSYEQRLRERIARGGAK